MKLTCYLMNRPPIAIRPAPAAREWMDNTSQRFAYRCLPLHIGNSHGWEICCEESFEATWHGGADPNAIEVSANQTAISHFGHGILTFHVACLFRTDPGWNLMVMGPVNQPKHGIQALTGIIETDWAPYSFTMNWLFTAPKHTIKFAKGEPFCFFFPIERGRIEQVEPVFCDMRKNADLYQQHEAWVSSRANFIADLACPHSDAVKEKWQRKYFHGLQMNGEPAPVEHQIKLKIKPFQMSEE